MRKILLSLVLLSLAPQGAGAQEADTAANPVAETIVSGLSQNRVSITANFDGDEILVYGAVKREGPAPEGRLDVIVTAEGPSGPVTIRRKERTAGIWINRDSVNVAKAPAFYAVATTGRLEDILSPEENRLHAISVDQLVRLEAAEAAATAWVEQGGDPDATPDYALMLNESEFIRAMVRVRTSEGRYRLLENRVQLNEQTLFRADLTLPSNLTEGTYRVRMFLLRDGKVIANHERWIRVRKEGLERMIFNLSQEQPLFYGLLSLAIAAAAGWGASAAFRLIRP
ncbi:TIGR02186 family protein [Pseudogemmobacter faecipullorum]|uniref:TIGR02186 family protein n=1 Tax=Pseudogemmobacter faecipullorum TaxID=2755041 RepID=A0ABS8CHZ1_9RHOB|nr:TIGR02186 family protein [Pseudogemmobacter faecipullorum]MCB5408994.1 TIGR02186 family protein [Pseudogemmobacter faecipullorum]